MYLQNPKRTRRTVVCLSAVISVLLTSGAGMAAAGRGCLSGNCHRELINVRYMHGPVAAEMGGVKGCEMCHVPAGAKCSGGKGGRFSFKSGNLCTLCHVKGTSTRHSAQEIEARCLNCHDPHGSVSSPFMLRVERKE